MSSYTVISGFYSNSDMLVKETFTDRRVAWNRVKELFAKTRTDHSGKAHPLAALEVYVPNTHNKGNTIYSFKRYEEGAPCRKWGAWGVSKFVGSGNYCG